MPETTMPTTLDPRFRTVLEAVATAAVDYGHSDTSSADVLARLLEAVESAFPGVTWTATAAGIREALGRGRGTARSRTAP